MNFGIVQWLIVAAIPTIGAVLIIAIVLRATRR
jgi:hypothetical protein